MRASYQRHTDHVPLRAPSQGREGSTTVTHVTFTEYQQASIRTAKSPDCPPNLPMWPCKFDSVARGEGRALTRPRRADAVKGRYTVAYGQA